MSWGDLFDRAAEREVALDEVTDALARRRERGQGDGESGDGEAGDNAGERSDGAGADASAGEGS